MKKRHTKIWICAHDATTSGLGETSFEEIRKAFPESVIAITFSDRKGRCRVCGQQKAHWVPSQAMRDVVDSALILGGLDAVKALYYEAALSKESITGEIKRAKMPKEEA